MSNIAKNNEKFYSKVASDIKSDYYKKYKLNSGVMVLSSYSEKGLKKLEKKLNIEEGREEVEEKVSPDCHSFHISFNHKNGFSNIFVTTSEKEELDREFHKIIRNNSINNSCGEMKVEHIALNGRVFQISPENATFNDEQNF